LVFLTSVLYVLSYAMIDKSKRIEDAQNHLQYGLLSQQTLLENWILDRAEEVRLLASFPASKDSELKTMASRFTYYHHYYDQIDAIVFIDETGQVQIDTASDEVIMTNYPGDLSDREYFIAAKNGEEYMYDVIQ